MKGQFQMESGSAMQGSGKTIPGFEQNPEQQDWLSGNAAPPLHPREDLQLDPLFLEDSWTLGVPAAIKNWEQRRLGRTLRAGQNRQPWEFESRGTTFSCRSAHGTRSTSPRRRRPQSHGRTAVESRSKLAMNARRCPGKSLPRKRNAGLGGENARLSRNGKALPSRARFARRPPIR